MRQDEVLAAGLADDARKGAVAVDLLSDRPQHAAKDLRRSREVHTGEIRIGEQLRGDRSAVAIDEVDHTVGQPGLAQQRHGEVRRILGVGRWLPDHGIAHQGRRRRQVSGDRREIEGRRGIDEALERPIVDAVPDARRRQWLLLQKPPHVVDVEAPEVDQLGRRVDFRLMRRLGLPEHGRGVQPVPPGTGEQIGRAQEDRRALLPRRCRPIVPGAPGCLDGRLHLGPFGQMSIGQNMAVRVRHDGRLEPAGRDLPAVDDQRQLDPPTGQGAQRRLQLRPLHRARRIEPDDLVFGRLEPRQACRRERHDTAALVATGATVVSAAASISAMSTSRVSRNVQTQRPTNRNSAALTTTMGTYP